jgi:hypothetical protein
MIRRDINHDPATDDPNYERPVTHRWLSRFVNKQGSIIYGAIGRGHSYDQALRHGGPSRARGPRYLEIAGIISRRP